ncbi:MAG: SpoIIE family protein phosphatase [Vicinamibacterales bacterium]
MVEAKLEITDALGRRVVEIERTPFTIGRREGNDLRLGGGEVSRDHAEIVEDGDRLLLKDKGSRYGSFVNEESVASRPLAHGDRIRLGRGGGAEMVFLEQARDAPLSEPATTAIGDLRQVAALLEGLRALGSGRVLDDVLALVLDSSIEVSGAERGFVMLATPENVLEFKMSRARGRVTLPGAQFQISRKIPEQVFETGEPRIVADLLDGDLANVHMGTVALGIRNVLCVPLRLVRYVDSAEAAGDERRLGVLYLDSRERGSLLSSSTRGALETLATEAAVAIENARLYRDSLEKAKLDQEIRIAAEIQQALLPKISTAGAFFDAAGSTLPCRSIGGDLYDCFELGPERFGFTLGDVSGKGPPAALLSALIQGFFSAQIDLPGGPADTVNRINRALVRRGVEARFATLVYGVLDASGVLSFCNAGHNPPVVIGPSGLRRLEACGAPVGMFESTGYESGRLALTAGETVVVFSDGVSEALNPHGEEFGEERLLPLLASLFGRDPQHILDVVTKEVRAFQGSALQNDDVTMLVVRYRG